MGRFEVRTTTPLGVTATEAWDYLMSHDEWRLPHVPVVTKLTEGPTTVGSRFENRVRGGGRSWTVINEITHIEPPERLSWRQVNDDGPTRTLEGHYLLESAGGGSMFTLHTVLETRGPASGGAWLNRTILEKLVYPRFLSRLRDALEG